MRKVAKESPPNTASKDAAQSASVLKVLAVFGIVGPILFATLFVVAGLLRPGFNFLTTFVSVLGFGTNAWIQNLNFILFGIFTVLFALGLHRGISGGKGSKLGPDLVAVFGGSIAGLGFFPGQPQPSGTIHLALFLVAIPASTFGILITSKMLRKEAVWKKYHTFSLICGIFLFAQFIFYTLASIYGFQVDSKTFEAYATQAATVPLAQYAGALQKLFFVAWLWVEVMAIRLLRVASRSTSGSEATLVQGPAYSQKSHLSYS